ncbi:ribosome biogenesis protein YTM1 [Fistulifera solaris]|uniref:Ribosome biogenesis protein YTM1 n=1 Tax=Fistulifera solaris TaxID=1519565 RepID=A0A1Z5K4H4_FISSO|nr:ribosome biogenesis protein YTM1 [Fistulifera solaris]|eukprot:GAX20981.1 ribosome biogenesis protein YTM1 [Fistulifera solaris]
MSDYSSSSDSDDGEKVRISLKLSASCNQHDLEVSSEPVAVPVDVTRRGLSAIINHLLDRKQAEPKEEDEDDDSSKLPSLNFDFILGSSNKLLRTSVGREARRQGHNFEQAITITYFPSQPAPEDQGESEPMPDWIGALSAVSGMVFAGCYDGSLQVLHEETMEPLVPRVFSHTGAIKCISSVARDDDSYYVATGSMDHSLSVQLYQDQALQQVASCIEGHNAAISSADFGSSSQLASGDWGGELYLWNLNQDISEQATVKKAKKDKSSETASHFRSLTPTGSMKAHSSQITGIAWNSSDQMITGSWDHSIKVWNVERQDCLLTLNSSRVVTCLDASRVSAALATGHPDCTVRLWDVRTKSETSSWSVSDNTFRPSHKAWVSAVQWFDAYQLVTTSHDGMVKWWDIRSSLPLHSIRAFSKNKGLALSTTSSAIYVGGTDNRVKRLQIPQSGMDVHEKGIAKQ